ncbi:MAG: nucleotide exchange factor GrpE [Lewinellaceae bacterium]|nr:nucleotide exchange factor GrpE [Lewinellaceae bacterium]
MKEKDPEQDKQEQAGKGQENPEQAENKTNNKAEGNEKVAELEKELKEAKDKFLYLFSDFENYKRNTAKERMELLSTAGRDILSALLPVLDDFDRANKNGAVSEGVSLIHNKLTHILQTKGLSMFETLPGDAFDPDKHEAVAEIPAPSEELKGKIVDITEQGYTLGERIIRFAKVVVGK